VAMQKIDVRVWATEGGGVDEEIWGIEEVRGGGGPVVGGGGATLPRVDGGQWAGPEGAVCR
jgi:hypothetical protein